MKIVATNRELKYKYEIKDSIECGIELKGTEVKAIRESNISLKESFALIRNNEVILKNMYISHYENGNINNVNETRDRKLLLHKDEIFKLQQTIKQGGFTLAPYKMYFKGQNVKIELAVCKGKKLYDKRESIKEREVKRKLEQVTKQNR
ncbi:MAG: SsrA-binding protein SmpB [Clostridia bacterium]|nr:SsrA-binding protein SmpB [Clostridia bacterium]MDD4375381.1 SsrA-binding protein SmpB [Clostridia bacterium]